MGNRAGIYLRISDDREGRELGITRQEEDCRAFAANNGYTVAMVFPENDTGASTSSKKPRPRYAEMLDAIRARQIDVVIAYSNSRLTRRPKEYEELIELHKATGVRYRTVVSGEDNLATADGRMIARIKASIDAGEVERTAERATREARQRAEQGRGNGGTRPYGWSAEDRRKLDRAEHKIIKECRNRLLAGESLRSIVADLNRREIPTVMGARWSSPALRGIMINPRLAGHRMYKGMRVGTGDWKPAITDLEHRQLVRILTDPTRRKQLGTARKSFLTGIALCGDCDGKIAGKTQMQRGVKRPYYWCQPCGLYRSASPINLYVDSVMAEFLRGYNPVDDPGVDAAAAEEAAMLRARIDDATAQFAESDSMTPAELDSVLRVLKRRLLDAETRSMPAITPKILDGTTGPNPVRPFGGLQLEQRRRIVDMFFTIKLHRARSGMYIFDTGSVEISPR